MTTSIITERTELPLLPLRDVVVFPHMVIPLFVGRPKSIKALEAAMEQGKSIMLAAQKAAQLTMFVSHFHQNIVKLNNNFHFHWLM